MTAPAPFVRAPLSTEDSLAESYHENTKIRAYMRDVEDDPAGASADLPPVASLVYAPESRRALPAPLALDAPLGATIRARRSRRAYSGEPIALAQAATLLGLAYGETGEGRAAPSAGGRYPLELFLVAQRVEGLAPGVWHYVPEAHALEPAAGADALPAVRRALFDQPFLADAAAIVVVGAVFGRNMVKYRDRGYRLVLLDAGHASENLQLAAEAMGLGACAMGGFVDDELNAICQLDGIGENVLLAIAVGSL